MGGLSGELLDAGQTVGFGIEGGLEATDGRRAVLLHLPGITKPLRLLLINVK